MPLSNTLRAMPLRSKLQLGFMVVSSAGIVVMVGSTVAWAVWSRVGGPMMLFDPRQDLCQAIGQGGFALMVAGVCGLAFVSGDASVRSRLQRYGGVLFWASALASLTVDYFPAYARMSIAELYATLLGKVIFGAMAVGFAGMLISMGLDLVARVAKPKTI